MKEYQKDCFGGGNKLSEGTHSTYSLPHQKKSIHKVFFAKIHKSFWESNGNKLSDQGSVLRKQGDLKKKKKKEEIRRII